MRQYLRIGSALTLLLAAGVACAGAGMDRATCAAAMAAYPKVHAALTAGQPRERVAAIIMAEGVRAGVDKGLLERNAARWVDMLGDVPPELLPAPEWVRGQRGVFCERYPK